MEPLSTAPRDVDERFARRLRERAGGDRPVSFADFMDLALFDPEVGYYASRRARVGKEPGTDFVTSTTFRAAFGPLVTSAAENLLGGDRAAASHAFIEIGAEPGCSLLDGVPHPFASVSTIRLSDYLGAGSTSTPAPLIAGPRDGLDESNSRCVPPWRCGLPSASAAGSDPRPQGCEPSARTVVFSNELFDAQPFHRLVWRAGAWREMGVSMSGSGLGWVEMAGHSDEVAGLAPMLPVSSEDGYILDLPWRAARLLERFAAPGWSGLFLAFDYGRTWRQLCEDFPQGTGRAYAGHRQSGDLLASPGVQDLTCHVCWDWLEAALRRSGFGKVHRQSQEAFFVTHARSAIEAIMTSDPSPLSPARSQLKQLLHPGLMGQRFEALWALRA